MSEYTPIDFNKVFPPTPTKLETYFNDLYERCAKMYNWTDNGKQISYQEAKNKLNSLYGRLAMPEKENNMREFITVHDTEAPDNDIILVRRSDITILIGKSEHETILYIANHYIGITVKDNIYNIIKKLDIKHYLFVHERTLPTFIKFNDIAMITPRDKNTQLKTKYGTITICDESYREVLLKIQEGSVL